ncbi:type II toxin-antitoxin system PemK/MazF family toxin [Thioalkalicoccus limnaeus]|uniref:Type II toxin-antitoxin system PemK/MazF family toxin n=1 Tax=Thioalkalicoccus limnaeus TaxID=120681 RepID=A0ABV4BFC9_9GAMM
MTRRYVPEADDILWLQFNLRAWHGQADHRPALVDSPSAYNGKTALFCCPMTTQVKGYPSLGANIARRRRRPAVVLLSAHLG